MALSCAVIEARVSNVAVFGPNSLKLEALSDWSNPVKTYKDL